MTVINTNIKSLVAQGALNSNSKAQATAMERLSTGKRINSAADDAAGLSISTKMTSQVRGLQMAVKNANDAISVTQTAEGAMTEINSILQRMRELAVQSSSDSNSAEDRIALQAEVSQLSSEVDRIATTTQFNGINILDGGFQNKTFQIGANAGQNMDISIGSMRSSVLGVASGSAVGSVSQVSSSAAGASTVVATGTDATAAEASLNFGDLSSDAITFTVRDGVSGLSATMTAQTLTMSDQYSRQAFVEGLNRRLAQSSADTSITGPSAEALTLNTTLAANADDLKFAIKIGSGPTADINILSRLVENGTSGTAAAITAMAAAIQTEVRAAFGDTTNASITVAMNAAGDAFVVTDAEGRAINISQGAGTGWLFGTDAANASAPLTVVATTQNNISAAWDGDDIVLTNNAGGKLTVDTFSSSATTTVMTFTAAAGQSLQLPEPIIFNTAAASNIDGTSGALFKGRAESSKMALTFSNRDSATAGAAVNYTFQITNGAGDVYANFTATSPLVLTSTATDASIVSEVKSQLAAALASLADKTIDVSEFNVEFSGNTLVIENTGGRALAIETFASNTGTMTVTPMNEVGASKTLASKNELFSQTRIGFGTKALNTTAGAITAGEFRFAIDGDVLTVTAGATTQQVLLDGSITTGTAFATALETKLQALTGRFSTVNGASTSATIDVSTIEVDFDAATNELVITDHQGRRVDFGVSSVSQWYGTGYLFDTDSVTAASNNGHQINTSSSKIQGDVYEATNVKLTLNQDSVTVNFSVNGVSLGSTAYVATDPFAGSALKTSLDAMMVALNASHPSTVFEYSVSGREITILQRDGGEVFVSGFDSAGSNDDALRMTISGAAGQGTTVIAQQWDSFQATASAQGTLAVATRADITLQGNDIYSMTVSDGVADYSLISAVLDVDNQASRQAFANDLNDALSGSGITGSIDSQGKVTLSRTDGGVVSLKSFSSVGRTAAVWSPSSGQGESYTLPGTGSLVNGAGVAAVASPVPSYPGGSSVEQISVLTRDGSVSALSVIDSALTYVNSERSKLGAIENRLGHTIENLSNVVMNTEASRSRIVDADYGAETAELARAMIVQQAATAMLAQANQSNQSVLSLLQ
jgi:flagellin